MRLIDADAIPESATAIDGKGRLYVAWSKIVKAPTIEAEPVKHGQWVFRNDGRYRQTRCYCTACGKHSGIGGIRENQLKPYCPNCGAKMDGEGKITPPPAQ